MRQIRFPVWLRPIAGLIAFSLVLPPYPAYALKPVETQEGSGLEELTRALKKFAHDAGLTLLTSGLEALREEYRVKEGKPMVFQPSDGRLTASIPLQAGEVLLLEQPRLEADSQRAYFALLRVDPQTQRLQLNVRTWGDPSKLEVGFFSHAPTPYHYPDGRRGDFLRPSTVTLLEPWKEATAGTQDSGHPQVSWDIFRWDPQLTALRIDAESFTSTYLVVYRLTPTTAGPSADSLGAGLEAGRPGSAFGGGGRQPGTGLEEGSRQPASFSLQSRASGRAKRRYEEELLGALEPRLLSLRSSDPLTDSNGRNQPLPRIRRDLGLMVHGLVFAEEATLRFLRREGVIPDDPALIQSIRENRLLSPQSLDRLADSLYRLMRAHYQLDTGGWPEGRRVSWEIDGMKRLVPAAWFKQFAQTRGMSLPVAWSHLIAFPANPDGTRAGLEEPEAGPPTGPGAGLEAGDYSGMLGQAPGIRKVAGSKATYESKDGLWRIYHYRSARGVGGAGGVGMFIRHPTDPADWRRVPLSVSEKPDRSNRKRPKRELDIRTGGTYLGDREVKHWLFTGPPGKVNDSLIQGISYNPSKKEMTLTLAPTARQVKGDPGPLIHVDLPTPEGGTQAVLLRLEFERPHEAVPSADSGAGLEEPPIGPEETFAGPQKQGISAQVTFHPNAHEELHPKAELLNLTRRIQEAFPDTRFHYQVGDGSTWTPPTELEGLDYAVSSPSQEDWGRLLRIVAESSDPRITPEDLKVFLALIQRILSSKDEPQWMEYGRFSSELNQALSHLLDRIRIRAEIVQFAHVAQIVVPEEARVIVFPSKAQIGLGSVVAKAWNRVLDRLHREGRIVHRYVMVPFPITDGDKERYQRLIRAMAHGLTFHTQAHVVAANVGAPFKTQGMELLDESDSKVAQGKATSLLVRREDGRLWGTLNDGEALADALEDKYGPLLGHRVVLLGAGGVGYPFGWEARKRGVRELVVADTDSAKADSLVEELKQAGFPAIAVAPDLPLEAGGPQSPVISEELHNHLRLADLVINATDYGRPHRPGSPLVDPEYSAGAVLLDANPGSTLVSGNFLEQGRRAARELGIHLRLEDGNEFRAHVNAAQVQDLLIRLEGLEGRNVPYDPLVSLFRDAFSQVDLPSAPGLEEFPTGLEGPRVGLEEPRAGLEAVPPARGVSEEMWEFVKGFSPAPMGVWEPLDPSETTRLILEAMERLKSFFKNRSVLDTGTGTGILALAALVKLGASYAVATDITSRPLDAARSHARRLKIPVSDTEVAVPGKSGRLEFHRGSLLDPVKGRRFDVAVFNASDPLRAEAYVREIDAHLKPDGLALLMWHRNSDSTLRAVARQHNLFFDSLLQNSIGWRVYALSPKEERLEELRQQISTASSPAGLEETEKLVGWMIAHGLTARLVQAPDQAFLSEEWPQVSEIEIRGKKDSLVAFLESFPELQAEISQDDAGFQIRIKHSGLAATLSEIPGGQPYSAAGLEEERQIVVRELTAVIDVIRGILPKDREVETESAPRRFKSRKFLEESLGRLQDDLKFLAEEEFPSGNPEKAREILQRGKIDVRQAWQVVASFSRFERPPLAKQEIQRMLAHVTEGWEEALKVFSQQENASSAGLKETFREFSMRHAAASKHAEAAWKARFPGDAIWGAWSGLLGILLRAKNFPDEQVELRSLFNKDLELLWKSLELHYEQKMGAGEVEEVEAQPGAKVAAEIRQMARKGQQDPELLSSVRWKDLFGFPLYWEEVESMAWEGQEKIAYAIKVSLTVPEERAKQWIVLLERPDSLFEKVSAAKSKLPIQTQLEESFYLLGSPDTLPRGIAYPHLQAGRIAYHARLAEEERRAAHERMQASRDPLDYLKSELIYSSEDDDPHLNHLRFVRRRLFNHPDLLGKFRGRSLTAPERKELQELEGNVVQLLLHHGVPEQTARNVLDRAKEMSHSAPFLSVQEVGTVLNEATFFLGRYGNRYQDSKEPDLEIPRAVLARIDKNESLSSRLGEAVLFIVQQLRSGRQDLEALRQEVWQRFSKPAAGPSADSLGAGLEEPGVRYITDTGRGISGVLEAAAFGARMRAAGLEEVEFAAVATEEELKAVLAGLEDPVAQEILAARTFTYEAGLEDSHAFALQMAQELVPDPQQVITKLTQATLSWFQGIAERLEVLELYQLFRDRVEELIQAA